MINSRGSADIGEEGTRNPTLRLAGKAHIPVREHMLKRDDLGHVSELFLTATTSEVLPTVRVDDQRIGDGKHAARLRSGHT